MVNNFLELREFYLVMSFAQQVSICRANFNLAIAPTEQELRLAGLQRPGMFGDRQIKQVLPPGQYSFNPSATPPWTYLNGWEFDVAQKRASHVRKPRLTRLADVSWQRLNRLDWTVYLPDQTSVVNVPIEIADDASLGYYNCRIIRTQDVITLRHRSIVVEYHYQPDYLDRYVIDVCGGCSIEHHEFAHVDMPLDNGSGHLVIGRIDPIDQALELTAFVVQPLQRVYIPEQTIHTNDFLLGKWETMLSSECEFPSAKLKPLDKAPSDMVHEHPLPLLAFSK